MLHTLQFGVMNTTVDVSRTDGALSDSEEEKTPGAASQQNSTSAWSKSKRSDEQGGYSSEASSEQGEARHPYSILKLSLPDLIRF